MTFNQKPNLQMETEGESPPDTGGLTEPTTPSHDKSPTHLHSRAPRGPAFSTSEDETLCKAWIANCSQPPSRRKGRDWKSIGSIFRSVHSDSHRSDKSLESRFRIIARAVSRFMEYLSEAEQSLPAGMKYKDAFDCAIWLHTEREGFVFQYHHAFAVLSTSARFQSDRRIATRGAAPTMRERMGSVDTSESSSQLEEDVEDGNVQPASEVGASTTTTTMNKRKRDDSMNACDAVNPGTAGRAVWHEMAAGGGANARTRNPYHYEPDARARDRPVKDRHRPPPPSTKKLVGQPPLEGIPSRSGDEVAGFVGDSRADLAAASPVAPVLAPPLPSRLLQNRPPILTRSSVPEERVGPPPGNPDPPPFLLQSLDTHTHPPAPPSTSRPPFTLPHSVTPRTAHNDDLSRAPSTNDTTVANIDETPAAHTATMERIAAMCDVAHRLRSILGPTHPAVLKFLAKFEQKLEQEIDRW